MLQVSLFCWINTFHAELNHRRGFSKEGGAATFGKVLSSRGAVTSKGTKGGRFKNLGQSQKF